MSSRIIIKNLPKDITREKLVEHVKKTCPKAEVTDCNLKFTRDGVFRRFAFVGFNSDNDAKTTQQKLNGTFIRTTRLQTDMAVDVGSKVNSWSKYTQNAKNSAKSKKGESDKSKEQEEVQTKKAPRTGLFVKMKGLSGFYTEKTVREFFKPIKPASIKIPRNAQKKPMGVAFVEFSTEKDRDQAMGRNKNFINSKKVFLKKTQETEAEPSKGPKPPPMWELKAKESSSQEVESIAESGRLFVRNLWFGVTEEELEELFGKFGPLAETTLPVDPLTKKSKGFAHVVFVFPEHALKAFTELDYTSLHGRLLHILPGRDTSSEGGGSNEKSSFKKTKDMKQKENSANSYNWNTLFLGANAVADAMASKYNTDKSQILDADSKGSVGVRVALGETQIVSETRQFLLDNGVALDAFSQASGKRSKTVILVKNLPAGVSSDELREVFGRHGSVSRVVMPPSGITAVVEFLEPSEARKAFLKLNFAKFRSIPLYLEWAPMGVFTKPPPPPKEEDDTGDVEDDDKENDDDNESDDESEDSEDEEGSEKEEEEEVKANTSQEKKKDDEDDDMEEELPEEGSTLFVKNLNFDTTDEKLKEHFDNIGQIYSATVAKKKDPRMPGELLSMGYGFVEFMKKADAKEALKLLQNSVLDNHNLELKMSTRTTAQVHGRKRQTEGKQTSTKIVVRNVPFEASQREIEELFKVFGELKFVRLPKKLRGTGSHRGFAFVDFTTKQDAKRAFNALCHSTHLYGRRLVLEWAETEDTVEDLRRKTAQHFSDDGPKRKRVKKTELMQELE